MADGGSASKYTWLEILSMNTKPHGGQAKEYPMKHDVDPHGTIPPEIDTNSNHMPTTNRAERAEETLRAIAKDAYGQFKAIDDRERRKYDHALLVEFLEWCAELPKVVMLVEAYESYQEDWLMVGDDEELIIQFLAQKHPKLAKDT
jgi:hypothetical protein